MNAPSRPRFGFGLALLVSLVVLGVPGAAALPAPAPAPATSTPAAAPTIEVGPNILVSRDGDLPHVELHVSANPKRTNNLVGGAITATRPDGGWACRTYATNDGGMTWKATEFSEQVEYGGGDPYTAFTPQGTAIFSALDFKKDEHGRQRGFLHVYRSTDGGMKWSDAMELGYSYDHEQIIVDQSSGKYSGRIYIGVLYGYPVYTVGVFRSEDDGRTWIGPVEAANGKGEIGINEVTPVVLSDGTLLLPYGDFEFKPEKRVSKGRKDSNLWTVTSTDGGISFGPPQKVIAQQWNLDDKETSIAGFGKFAADTSSKKFKDRIYVTWEDARLGPYRVFVSHSADRGKTWSAPKPIDGSVAKTVQQVQQAIAVNKDGTVAVTWFDMRNGTDGKMYDQYFAASVDGGETFSTAVKVSSAISNPRGRGNSQMAPLMFKGGSKEDTVSMAFISAGSRWGSGGDYMGLAADREGVFHPFWADSRSGTFQVYTATVKVSVPRKASAAGAGAPDADEDAAPPPPKPAPPAERKEASLTSRVEIVFDPTSYDPSTKQAEIPVRIKNTSDQPIYGPVRLEIAGFGFPEYENDDDKKRNAENAPSALNATNGKPKEGAVFDFKGALGTADALEPGAVSGPILLKFQFVDANKAPGIRWKVTGMVPPR